MSSRPLILILVVASLTAPSLSGQELGSHVVLVNNDLGMHCMNRIHANMSILPPFNTLQAQVIERGSAGVPPRVVTADLSLTYSFPGNTYSVGKTDFWDWDQDLFGVDLPPNVGLTGKGLADAFDVEGDLFVAVGIPVTPYMDDEPAVEVPFQVAEVILRDHFGVELARAYPVAPVSTEINCVTSGCHSSENSILMQHDDDGGFDPDARPILCASCHGSTPLTGPNPGSAGWFSKRIHDQHSFIDQSIPGMAGCYKCHPGPNTRCLRGTMGHDFGLTCQDCHGSMDDVAESIDDGRIPWVEEPACRTCHTAVYGEPAGTLYRNARGHGGVLCSNCHNSPHAIFPSREAADNRVMVDLQGHAGTLSDCRVCHGTVPTSPGPHGYMPTAVDEEIGAIADQLRVFPSPARAGTGCTVLATSGGAGTGRLLVFDARGRTVRLLRASATTAGSVSLAWDGMDSHGAPVAAGTYFLRWDDGTRQAGGKVVMVR